MDKDPGYEARELRKELDCLKAGEVYIPPKEVILKSDSP